MTNVPGINNMFFPFSHVPHLAKPTLLTIAYSNSSNIDRPTVISQAPQKNGLKGSSV